MSKAPEEGRFAGVASKKSHEKYSKCIEREELYSRADDIRSEFARDYNRILHCTAFSRLKHKTQVFFATENDHICTRMEHVNHVASISYTISKHMGLNTQLATAIALGHDLGHAPFGHAGEDYIDEIAKEELGADFWHERNSLRFVDKIETLKDTNSKHQNLKLTYAVRDGIISHCGEVAEDALFPRSEAIDLTKIIRKNEYMPYTWEGCVVKIADKIAYIGRDIEDAIRLDIWTEQQAAELSSILNRHGIPVSGAVNNTILIHKLIIDLCNSSDLDDGLRFSQEMFKLMKLVMEFNYNNIYSHRRLDTYKKFAKLAIGEIFVFLISLYAKEYTLKELEKHAKHCPSLTGAFKSCLLKYSNYRTINPYKKEYQDVVEKYENEILYDINKKKDYIRAILDYMSGMTDSFAVRAFGELTSFK